LTISWRDKKLKMDKPEIAFVVVGKGESRIHFITSILLLTPVC
jgi:hypothetical protein